MLGLGGDDKIKAFHKAINPTIPPTAPKRKHVRKIIVDSWTYGAINIFKQMQREPLDKNGLCCFKALTVIHKILQEGAPRVLNECYNHLSIIHALQKIWSSALAQDPHYAKLNAEYAYFLRGKTTFHHKHPLVLGNLSLDDYRQKIQNQPEVPIQTRQQMISHLLDLQGMILRVQQAIFAFHGRDLHESKVAALVPLVVESDALYRITVHHLHALCDRTTNNADIESLIQRFYDQYKDLRVFYDSSSRINYVTSLISVPSLPHDPPIFNLTGTLAHLVPQATTVIKISSLMNEDGQASQREQPRAQPQATPQFGGNQNQPMNPINPFGSQSQPNAFQPPVQQQQQQQQQPSSQPKAAPSGWVTFGGPVQQPQSIQVTQVPQQVPQVAQQVATPQVPNIDLDKIRAYIQQLENLLRDKDAEISYWKSMCEQAQQQQAELFHTANENSRRADELEMHLQNIMQEIQDDKHRRLMKKLENAVNSVRSALGNLTDASNKGNPFAKPDQLLESHYTMQDILGKAQEAAFKRSHSELTPLLKQLVLINKIHTDNVKGVSELTDDPALKNGLLEATARASEALKRLLEVIKLNPYDADAINAEIENVKRENEGVRVIVEKIINSEKVDEVEIDISDKAIQELLRAVGVIEQCTRDLLAAKEASERAAKEKNAPNFDIQVNEAIMNAAMAITEATSGLVKYAAAVQQENLEAGRTSGGGKVYRKDITWSEGLISAAKGVAASVSELVRSANNCVLGKIDEEALVAASKSVAASTTQLVVASRVRSDPNSQSQKKLEDASKSVTQATRLLLAAARTAGNIDLHVQEPEDLSKLTITEFKVKEMEQQTQILKLEKQLELARFGLSKIRKSQYKP